MDKMLVYDGRYIKVRDIDWTHRFIMSIFGTKSIDVDYEAVEEQIKYVTSALTEREIIILKYRFGIAGKPMTLEQVGEKLNLSRERIRQIQAGTLRKMRHPSKARWFRGEYCYVGAIHGYYSDIEYIKEFIEPIIIKEIENKITGKSVGLVYLPLILERNAVEIKFIEPYKENVEEICLDELELSSRCYNILKNFGANTVGDIFQVSRTEVFQLRCGRRTVEEISNAIKQYRMSGKIQLIYDGESKLYRYNENNANETAKKVFNGLIENNQSILEMNFTPGLISLLLLKGYLFKSVLDCDIKDVISILKNASFESFAQELEKYKEFLAVKKISEESPVCKILQISAELSKMIERHKCSSVQDLLYLRRNEKVSEELQYVINEISNDDRTKEYMESARYIECLKLNDRGYYMLKRAGVNRISQLEQMSLAELRAVRNLGEIGLRDIFFKMKAAGHKMKCFEEDEYKCTYNNLLTDDNVEK